MIQKKIKTTASEKGYILIKSISKIISLRFPNLINEL
jgi:hypothetical protein